MQMQGDRRALTGIPFQFDSDDPNLWLQKMSALAVVGAVLVSAVILGASVLRIVGGHPCRAWTVNRNASKIFAFRDGH